MKCPDGLYGQTGGGTAYHSGTIRSYAYSYNVTTYTRVLAIDILDRQLLDAGKTKKVYEVELTSKGWCGQIAGVFDEMLDALFEEFPGESGKSRTTSVSWDRGKC